MFPNVKAVGSSLCGAPLGFGCTCPALVWLIGPVFVLVKMIHSIAFRSSRSLLGQTYEDR